MTRIDAQGLGVRFRFDRLSRVLTPARARLARGVRESWGVRGASLSIGAGEGVALIGPSGAGKTTLLRAIAGVLPADEGEVRSEGRIGTLLSIDAGLLPTLTGQENAQLLGVLAGMSRAAVRQRLDAIRAESELAEFFDRPASTFSQGMRARLALAASAGGRPEILLLDEVHEALDHVFRDRLAERAREICAAGGIVIAAGHDHEVLGRICERAVHLNEGRLVADGPFEEVRAAYLYTGAAARVE